MDLQTARAHNDLKWSWTRNGALVLFFVAGILLVASLTTTRSHQPQTSLLAGHSSHTNTLL